IECQPRAGVRFGYRLGSRFPAGVWSRVLLLSSFDCMFDTDPDADTNAGADTLLHATAIAIHSVSILRQRDRIKAGEEWKKRHHRSRM
ncbi:MAG: hypothetical protein KGK33_09585, partial [Hyphomicrobiales bacterium]|nr:hypothetical protein [Hyphomicrobiales bacterium]